MLSYNRFLSHIYCAYIIIYKRYLRTNKFSYQELIIRFYLPLLWSKLCSKKGKKKNEKKEKKKNKIGVRMESLTIGLEEENREGDSI